MEELTFANEEDVFIDASDKKMAVTVTCPDPACTAGDAGAAWSHTGPGDASAAIHLQDHISSAHSTAAAPAE